ncbi:MAG TPA: hypothetical protein PKH65_02240 [Bacteroidia bacterium]|nr:hypothetical protein [Bacteroidia bacterium]
MKNLLTLLCLSIIIPTQAQHVLITNSGIKHSGRLVSILDDVVKFNVNGSPATFSIKEVNTISFSNNTGSSGVTTSSTSTGNKAVSYTMNGREMIKIPSVDNLTQERGVVVVEVTINKYGNVIKAVPGVEGSNTQSKYLHTKAQQAAQSAQFDTSPTMPLEQKGSITIIF